MPYANIEVGRMKARERYLRNKEAIDSASREYYWKNKERINSKRRKPIQSASERADHLTAKLRARFQSYLRRNKVTGCLEWMGYKDVHGYGKLWIGSQKDGTLRKEMSHRVAWILAGKEITPEKPFILHNCPCGDNPSCCEIAHLWDGTAADNNTDRSRKDRSRRSELGLPRGVQPNYTQKESYQARIQVGSKQIYIGSYSSIEEARQAVEAAGGWRQEESGGDATT